MSWHQFHLDLQTAQQTHHFTSYYAFVVLDRMADFAEKTPKATNSRYLQPLKNLLTFFQTSMNESTYHLLQNDLDTIPLV
jgi:hypothetical protein